MNDNSVALITGASRGLGEALALCFAQNGYDIAAVFSSNESGAAKLSKQISSLGRKILTIKANVGVSEEVNGAIKNVDQTFGRVDVLINNAGTVKNKTIYAMTDSDWQEVMAVNLNGPFYFTRAVLPLMRRQKGGSILNISSYLASRPNKGAANYAASKAALVSLTKSTAVEEGEFNIRANAIAPGFHVTDMNKDVWGKYEKIRASHLLSQMPSREEFAAFAFHVAQLKTVTGQVFSFESRLI